MEADSVVAAMEATEAAMEATAVAMEEMAEEMAAAAATAADSVADSVAVATEEMGVRVRPYLHQELGLLSAPSKECR